MLFNEELKPLLKGTDRTVLHRGKSRLASTQELLKQPIGIPHTEDQLRESSNETTILYEVNTVQSNTEETTSPEATQHGLDHKLTEQTLSMPSQINANIQMFSSKAKLAKLPKASKGLNKPVAPARQRGTLDFMAEFTRGLHQDDASRRNFGLMSVRNSYQGTVVLSGP